MVASTVVGFGVPQADAGVERRRSGRPGRQPGEPTAMLCQVDDPDEVTACQPERCTGCGRDLASAELVGGSPSAGVRCRPAAAGSAGHRVPGGQPSLCVRDGERRPGPGVGWSGRRSTGRSGLHRVPHRAASAKRSRGSSPRVRAARSRSSGATQVAVTGQPASSSTRRTATPNAPVPPTTTPTRSRPAPPHRSTVSTRYVFESSGGVDIPRTARPGRHLLRSDALARVCPGKIGGERWARRRI